MSSDSAGSTPSSAASSRTRVPDQPQRRDREVEQVHRHLRAERLAALGLADLEAVGLDARQAAARLADAPGDALGQLDVRRNRG